MSRLDPNVRETDADKIGGFDPHEDHVTYSGGITESHKGTYVTDLEGPETKTAMPKPLKR